MVNSSSMPGLPMEAPGSTMTATTAINTNTSTNSTNNVINGVSQNAAAGAGAAAPHQQPTTLFIHHPTMTMDAVGQGGMYTGPINVASGLPHGHNGSMEYAENNTNIASYVGQWELGFWQGTGTCRLVNGDVYKGQFSHHERHGNGEYTWLPTHTGTSTKQRLYQGSFQHNQRHGHGKYVWKTIHAATGEQSISTYVGNFDNGLRQGQGVYSSPKLQYTGDWLTGQYHGYGVLELYEAPMPMNQQPDDDDEPAPPLSIKSIYKGYFVKGRKEGRGVETLGDGSVRHDGLWKQDRPVIEEFPMPVHPNQTHAAPSTHYAATTNKNNNNHAAPTGTGNAASSHVSAAANNSNDSGSLHKRNAAAASGRPPAAANASKASNGHGGTHSSSGLPMSTVLSTPQQLADGHGTYGMYRGIVENGVPEGVGTMTYAEGHHSKDVVEYEGFWQAGIPHGFGRVQHGNGDTYQGNFVQGCRQGQGEYIHCSTYATAVIYKGLFHNDLPNGEGFKVIYPNQDVYIGEFVNGEKHGKEGRLDFHHDGSYYTGSWESGLYHGQGELVTPTCIYRGSFKTGLYSGQGTLIRAMDNVILYAGDWDEGYPTENSEAMKKTLTKEQLFIPEPPVDFWNEPKPQEAPLQGLIRKLSPNPSSFGGGALSRSTSNDHSNNAGTDTTTSSLTTSLSSLFGFSGSSTRETSTSSANGTATTNNNNNNNNIGHGPTTRTGTTGMSSANAAAGPADHHRHAELPSKSHPPPSVTQDNTDKEPCKAVVDMSVWDGQDNPGKYTGILHIPSQRPHGVGRMVYSDGNRIHEGFWEYGHRQGHGRCLFVQIGDYHEGNYHQNLRQGPGKYYWKDGRQFIGHYHQDERHGEGKFIYPNGDVYEGNFSKGQRNGHGTFTFGQKNCTYNGEWKDGVYHGAGILEWADHNAPNHYVCSDDSDHQRPSALPSIANIYKGEFQHGLFHGPGIEMVGDTILRQGIWDRGQFVRDTSNDDAAAGTRAIVGAGVTVSSRSAPPTEQNDAMPVSNNNNNRRRHADDVDPDDGDEYEEVEDDNDDNYDDEEEEGDDDIDTFIGENHNSISTMDNNNTNEWVIMSEQEKQVMGAPTEMVQKQQQQQQQQQDDQELIHGNVVTPTKPLEEEQQQQQQQHASQEEVPVHTGTAPNNNNNNDLSSSFDQAPSGRSSMIRRQSKQQQQLRRQRPKNGRNNNNNNTINTNKASNGNNNNNNTPTKANSNLATAECASSIEQTFEDQRLQWRKSLDVDLASFDDF